MAVYGIDLGTTRSTVAVASRGVVRIAPLDGTSPTLDSVVLLDARDLSHPTATVGLAALERHHSLCQTDRRLPHGVTLIRGSKRHMAAVGPVPSGPPWWLGDLRLTSTDIAAVLLRALVERASHAEGMPPVDGVVVTHPQRFRNRERRAVAQSARLAGLDVVATMPEPDAAAWAYGLCAKISAPSARFMVFDFGGGTLDVTVLVRDRKDSSLTLRAVASQGIELGGAAIDDTLRELLFARYAHAIARPSLCLDDLDDLSSESLLGLAENVKIQLNQHASTDPNPHARSATRTFSLSTRDGEVLPKATVALSLTELGESINETIERAADCAHEASMLAGVELSALDEVLLVGGSSWLYPMQTRLRSMARAGAVRLFDDPDDPLNPALAIASGAALWAEKLADGDGLAEAWRGVIPDALGVRAREADPTRPGERRETMAMLVPALTSVPFEGRRVFRKRGTATVLPVEVLEGRSLSDATPLGRFEIFLPSSIPDGAPVEVLLRIGRDGVLSLAVRDPETDTTRTVTLDDTDGLYADDELSDRRQRLAAITWV